MLSFEDMTAQRLIDRYNVALAQAVLLRSVRVVAEVRNEGPARYRQLFRRLKFHRLVYRVEGDHAEGYTFHDRRPPEPVQRDHQVRAADGALPAGPAALPRLPARRRAALGPEARAAELPPRRQRRADLAPGRHGHVRPGRDRRVRRAVPPGRAGLGAERGHRGRRAGPRGGLGARLPGRPQGDRRPTSSSRSSASGRRRASTACSACSRAWARPGSSWSISEKLKVDEDAVSELPGPILRFKEIPNAPELAGLLETFLKPADAPARLF